MPQPNLTILKQKKSMIFFSLFKWSPLDFVQNQYRKYQSNCYNTIWKGEFVCRTNSQDQEQFPVMVKISHVS